jgi:hypothetical protein
MTMIKKVSIPVFVAGTILALAACTPTATPPPTGSPLPSDSASASASPTPTPTPTPTFALESLSADDVHTIQDAVSNDDFTSLGRYLGNPVEVAFAASEFDKNRSPGSAITDLAYIKDGDTWTWPPDGDTLAAFRSGFYGKWFPENSIIGISDNEYVVSFTVVGSMITKVFATNFAQTLIG